MVAFGVVVVTALLGAGGLPWWATLVTGIALAVLIVDHRARAARIARGGVTWRAPPAVKAGTFATGLLQGCAAAAIAYAGGRIIGVAVAGG
ncbi:MAG: hypothetical protein AAFR04_01890 [Pseudomonadota bacterium]